MQYKIMNFDATTGSLIVKFYTEELPEGPQYAIALPIVDGEYISADALHMHIMSFAPYEHIARLVAVKAATPPVFEYAPQGTGHVLDSVTSLDEAKIKAIQAIDIEAASTRVRFLTPIYGQEMTYMTKVSQAQQFKEAGYLGEPPSYIAAEATATGVSPQQLAETILISSEKWANYTGPQLEATRVAAKANIRAANTIEEVKTIFAAAIDGLQKLTLPL